MQWLNSVKKIKKLVCIHIFKWILQFISFPLHFSIKKSEWIKSFTFTNTRIRPCWQLTQSLLQSSFPSIYSHFCQFSFGLDVTGLLNASKLCTLCIAKLRYPWTWTEPCYFAFANLQRFLHLPRFSTFLLISLWMIIKLNLVLEYRQPAENLNQNIWKLACCIAN